MLKTSSLFGNIRGDMFGGITAGIVALPLALAFGEQTELGAIAGLYGAIALGILAAIFGGTKTQISGPTAPMTVVSAVIIAEAVKNAGSVEAAMPIIVATFVLSGLMQAMLGIMKLGQYIKYIPYPVVSGFMSGIGFIIVITQIFPFFGFNSPSGGAYGTITEIHRIPEIFNFYSVLLAGLTIAIIYLFPKITKKVPSSLVALLVISIGAYFLIPVDAILRINSNGPIPTGLPVVHFDFFGAYLKWENLVAIAEYASTLAALGAIDSLLTSVVADNMTKTKHDSNRELIGQGIGNMAAGFIGGLPGAGATMRTVINIKTGGKTPISGVIAGLLLFAILMGLGSLVGHVPNAVLAGILITVGIGIIDYKSLKLIRNIPRTDAVIMISVLALTVLVDLLAAVAAGMVLASLLFMIKASKIVEANSKTEPIGDFKPETPWKDEAKISKISECVYIKHIEGPLFFGFTAGFQDLVKNLPKIKIIIIRMDRVPYVDHSGLYAMEDAILDLKQRGMDIVFTGLTGQPKIMFQKIGIIPNLVPIEQCFENIHSCESWLTGKMKENKSKNQ